MKITEIMEIDLNGDNPEHEAICRHESDMQEEN